MDNGGVVGDGHGAEEGSDAGTLAGTATVPQPATSEGGFDPGVVITPAAAGAMKALAETVNDPTVAKRRRASITFAKGRRQSLQAAQAMLMTVAQEATKDAVQRRRSSLQAAQLLAGMQGLPGLAAQHASSGNHAVLAYQAAPGTAAPLAAALTPPHPHWNTVNESNVSAGGDMQSMFQPGGTESEDDEHDDDDLDDDTFQKTPTGSDQGGHYDVHTPGDASEQDMKEAPLPEAADVTLAPVEGWKATPLLKRRSCCMCFGRPRWAHQVWLLLDEPTSSRAAFWVGWAVLVLIFISTLSFVLETVESIKDGGGSVLEVVETTSIVIFTVELGLRFMTCPNQLAFLTGAFNWIDLLAIMPFYVEIIVPSASGAGSVGVIRVLRLVRVARVVKVSRYSASIKIFSKAMTSSMRPLTMLVFLVTIAMVVFSSGLYYAELTIDGCRSGWWSDPSTGNFCLENRGGWVRVENSKSGEFMFQGQQVQCVCLSPNPYDSIPTTFWWCLVTMTTVGYGDNVPVTAVGRFVAVITMLCGIIILALPITVIGTNFARVLRQIQHDKMLQELANLDRNDDGVIDGDELKQLLKTLQALAPSEEMARAIPASGEKLMKKYDADNSGVLEAAEMAMLKRDLAAVVTPSHPAYQQLVDESEQELRKAGVNMASTESVQAQVTRVARINKASRASRSVRVTGATTGSTFLNPRSTKESPSRARHRANRQRPPTHTATVSRRFSADTAGINASNRTGSLGSMHDSSPTAGRRVVELPGAPSDASFVVDDAGGVPPPVYTGPQNVPAQAHGVFGGGTNVPPSYGAPGVDAMAVLDARLAAIELGVDRKLASIADVLNIINMSLHQTADPVM